MLGGYNISPLVDLLDDSPVALLVRPEAGAAIEGGTRA